MSNPATLRPITDHARAVELGRRGGLASGRARARQKSLRELLLLELEKPYKAPFDIALDGEKVQISKGQRVVQALVDAACVGVNTRAQQAIFKLLNEKGGADADQDEDELETDGE